MNDGFISSLFEWRVEKFFFLDKVFSPPFSLCSKPEKKAQLMLYNDNGFLSVHVVFLPGSENVIDQGSQHYLTIIGKNNYSRCDFTKETIGNRRALMIERMISLTTLENHPDIYAPNGVVIFQYLIYQRYSFVRGPLYSTSVSSLNVSNIVKSLSIPVESVQTKQLDFPFTLTYNIDVTIRMFVSEDQLCFGLASEGRTHLTLEMSVKLLNHLDCIPGKQRHRMLLKGTSKMADLPFRFPMRRLSAEKIHLEFGFLFHERGDVAYLEHCEKDMEVAPSKSSGKRPCVMVAKHDVHFHVQGRQFSSNQEVLSKQSLVFERMFATDMSEALSGRVEVTDVSPEAVELFLSFFNTGGLQLDDHADQLSQIAELYLLSDRYMVKSLRQACQKRLMSNIQDAETAILGLRLAIVYGDEEGFKNQVEDFLSTGSGRQVLYSQTFREFVREFPVEGNKIMYKTLMGKNLK